MNHRTQGEMTVSRLPLERLSIPDSSAAMDSNLPVPVAPFTPLAAFGPTTPHTLPLLVKLPEGGHHQFDVPSTATLSSLRNKIQAEANVDLKDMDLYFGDIPLSSMTNAEAAEGDMMSTSGLTVADNAEITQKQSNQMQGEAQNQQSKGEVREKTLEEYGIPQCYDVAGGMLGVVKDGVTDVGKRIKAVEGINRVVVGIRKGESDTEKLVKAAMEIESDNEDNKEKSNVERKDVEMKVHDEKKSQNTAVANSTGKSTSEESADKEPKEDDILQELQLDALKTPRYTDSSAYHFPSQTNGLHSLDLSTLGNSSFMGMSPRAISTPSNILRSLSKSQPDLFPPTSARKILTTPRFSEISIQEKRQIPLVDNENGADSQGQQTWFDGVYKSFDANGQTAPASAPPAAPTVVTSNCMAAKNKSAPVRNTRYRCKRFDTNPATSSMVNSAMESNQAALSSFSHLSQQSQDAHSTGTLSESSLDNMSSKTHSKASTPTKSATTAMASQSLQQQSSLSPQQLIKSQPKKRGRKRKHPELSDAERKALRQAQNRESAKQSRIRRKTMAAEYEKKMSVLNDENDQLRDQVSVLNNRLTFLQSLLTVSVNPKKVQALENCQKEELKEAACNMEIEKKPDKMDRRMKRGLTR